MDRRMDRDGQCPAPDRGRGERSSPVGSWPRRGLGVRARRGGVACLGGAPEWGGGFAGSCSPTVGDRDPTGSPAAPPTPPPRQHCKGHKGFAGGLVGGGGCSPRLPTPCTPSASLSLPSVHGLRPPCGDGGPLLLCQRPGGAQGVGVSLGIVIPWLEVSGTSGCFVQGGQVGQGGLGGAQPWGDPLRLDADGLVLRGGAGGRGRLFGGHHPAADPGVRREEE